MICAAYFLLQLIQIICHPLCYFLSLFYLFAHLHFCLGRPRYSRVQGRGWAQRRNCKFHFILLFLYSLLSNCLYMCSTKSKQHYKAGFKNLLCAKKQCIVMLLMCFPGTSWSSGSTRPTRRRGQERTQGWARFCWTNWTSWRESAYHLIGWNFVIS